MEEVFIKERTLPHAYHTALKQLDKYGVENFCADYNQKQIECSMTIHITEPTAEPRISRLLIGGAYDLQRYELEIVEGILDFEIGKGNWEYTYHQRMEEQIEFVVAELKRNPTSRRAVIHIGEKSDALLKSPPCLQLCHFFIRNNKLDQEVLFRSNDLPEAFFFNAWALIRLQELIADRLDVDVGTYTHRSNSMHCYEKNYGVFKSFVGAAVGCCGDELEYYFEGFFQELMADEIPKIAELVETQRLKTLNSEFPGQVSIWEGAL